MYNSILLSILGFKFTILDFDLIESLSDQDILQICTNLSLYLDIYHHNKDDKHKQHIHTLHNDGGKIVSLHDFHKEATTLSKAISLRRVKDKYPLGVNLIGYFGKHFGLAQNSAIIEQSLIKLNIHYTCISVELKDNIEYYIYNINIYAINEIDSTLLHRDRLNICLPAWEFEYPAHFYEHSLKYYDEIWTISDFCKKCYRPFSDAEINTMNILHEVNCDLTVNQCREKFNIAPEAFVVMFIFDVNSDIKRKNPMAVLQAFNKSIAKRPNSLLVMKVKNDHNNIVKNTAKAYANVQIIDQDFNDKNDIYRLLNCCDVYISLHCSEGFGLTLAEAMCLAKPIIATGYSGSNDFIKAEHSFVVDYTMVNIESDIPNYQLMKNKCKWAQADVTQAATYLTMLYNNRILAEEYGKLGQSYIKQKYNYQVLSNQIKDSLNNLMRKKSIAKCITV